MSEIEAREVIAKVISQSASLLITEREDDPFQREINRGYADAILAALDAAGWQVVRKGAAWTRKPLPPPEDYTGFNEYDEGEADY